MAIRYGKQLEGTACFQSLVQDIKRGRPAHCYLFLSRDEIAADSMVRLFAAAVFCGAPPCLECLECRKVFSGTHENVAYFPAPGEKFAPADAAELAARLSYASDGRPRLFVVRGFDEASEAAQNKMLKTLEEPSKDAVIVLLAKESGGVLNTVLSRARRLVIDPLPPEPLAEGLFENYFGGAEEYENRARAEWAAAFSGGNISVAERMLGEKRYREIYDAVSGVLAGLRSSRGVLGAAGRLSPFLSDADTVLDFFSMLIRDVYLFKTGNTRLVSGRGREEFLSGLSDVYSLGALANMQAIIMDGKKRLRAYCGAAGVVDGMLMGFMEERAKCQR